MAKLQSVFSDFFTSLLKTLTIVLNYCTSIGCFGKLRKSLQNDWNAIQIYLKVIQRHLEYQFGPNFAEIDLLPVIFEPLDTADSQMTVNILKIFSAENEPLMVKIERLAPNLPIFLDFMYQKMEILSKDFNYLHNLFQFSKS